MGSGAPQVKNSQCSPSVGPQRSSVGAEVTDAAKGLSPATTTLTIQWQKPAALWSLRVELDPEHGMKAKEKYILDAILMKSL